MGEVVGRGAGLGVDPRAEPKSFGQRVPAATEPDSQRVLVVLLEGHVLQLHPVSHEGEHAVERDAVGVQDPPELVDHVELDVPELPAVFAPMDITLTHPDPGRQGVAQVDPIRVLAVLIHEGQQTVVVQAGQRGVRKGEAQAASGIHLRGDGVARWEFFCGRRFMGSAYVDAKGGAALSITSAIDKPIAFVGIGQEYGDIMPFDSAWVVERIFA